MPMVSFQVAARAKSRLCAWRVAYLTPIGYDPRSPLRLLAANRMFRGPKTYCSFQTAELKRTKETLG